MIPSVADSLSRDGEVYQRGLVIDSQLGAHALDLGDSVSKGIGD